MVLHVVVYSHVVVHRLANTMNLAGASWIAISERYTRACCSGSSMGWQHNLTQDCMEALEYEPAVPADLLLRDPGANQVGRMRMNFGIRLSFLRGRAVLNAHLFSDHTLAFAIPGVECARPQAGGGSCWCIDSCYLVEAERKNIK